MPRCSRPSLPCYSPCLTRQRSHRRSTAGHSLSLSHSISTSTGTCQVGWPFRKKAARFSNASVTGRFPSAGRQSLADQLASIKDAAPTGQLREIPHSIEDRGCRADCCHVNGALHCRIRSRICRLQFLFRRQRSERRACGLRRGWVSAGLTLVKRGQGD